MPASVLREAPLLGSLGTPLQPSREMTALVAEPPEATSSGGHAADRRASNRRPYAYLQLLAPYDGHTPPVQSEFQLVDCHDISPSGFSFTVESIPESQFVMIALGIAPFSFFSAEIVRTELLDGHSKKNVRVGCRFLQRVGG